MTIFIVRTIPHFTNPFSSFRAELKKLNVSSEDLQDPPNNGSHVDGISIATLFKGNYIQFLYFLYIFSFNIFVMVLLLGSLYRIENIISGGIIAEHAFSGTFLDYMYIAMREIVGLDLYTVSFQGTKANFLLFLGSLLNIYIFAILILSYTTFASVDFQEDLDKMREREKQKDKSASKENKAEGKNESVGKENKAEGETKSVGKENKAEEKNESVGKEDEAEGENEPSDK